MNSKVILGLGSSYGDDAVGWRVVEHLKKRLPTEARLVVIAEPTQIIEHLHPTAQVWIVDACRGKQPVGSIVRFTWPEDRLLDHAAANTHSLSLSAVLQLAAALDKLPAALVIFAIEIGPGPFAGDELSPPVATAANELAQRLAAEVAAT